MPSLLPAIALVSISLRRLSLKAAASLPIQNASTPTILVELCTVVDDDGGGGGWGWERWWMGMEAVVDEDGGGGG